MGRSIYKTDDARQTMARWYEHYVGKLDKYEVEFAEVDTRFGKTNVLITGPEDAPPLWCFHGAMASAPMALDQVPQLVDNFRIYFPDTPGQPGRSDETRLDWQGDDHGHWVVDVIDQMGFDTIQACGVSLGGYVILRCAAVAPERIDTAVLWVPGGLVKGHFSSMLGLIWDGLAYAMFKNPDRLLKIMDRNFTEYTQEGADYFSDSLKHVNPDRRFPQIAKDGQFDDWDARIMLITHGLDTVFPPEQLVPRARQLFKNIEVFETIPEFKHAPPQYPEKLDPIMEKIVAFLNQGAEKPH